MTLDPLASLDDLKNLKVEYDDENLAKSLLESVSAAVRAAAGNPISRGTWTVTIPSEPSRKLDLPSRPVISVSSVQVKGEAVDDWTLLGNALYRDRMWNVPGGTPVPVTITYTAGYDPVPPDIVRLVCVFVAAGISQQNQGGPGAHRDIAYERIDDGQIGYRQGGDEIVDAAEIPKTTCDALRARFGAPGINVGVFR